MSFMTNWINVTLDNDKTLYNIETLNMLSCIMEIFSSAEHSSWCSKIFEDSFTRHVSPCVYTLCSTLIKITRLSLTVAEREVAEVSEIKKMGLGLDTIFFRLSLFLWWLKCKAISVSLCIKLSISIHWRRYSVLRIGKQWFWFCKQ